MAKTPVKIEVDGYKEREVLALHYEFDQETDIEGQMSGIPRGGLLTVRVKALNDGNSELCAWMLERSLPKDGKVTFLETKTNKQMKTIEFKTAYCVDYTEEWVEGQMHTEVITITCKEIAFGNVKFENQWK